MSSSAAPDPDQGVFHDVTIIYDRDTLCWTSFLQNKLKQTKVEQLRLNSVLLDETITPEKQSELSTCIGESYVTILLTSPGLLDNFEENATWLTPVLGVESDVSTVYCLYLNVDHDDVEDVLVQNHYPTYLWVVNEIFTNCGNIADVISDVVRYRDLNKQRHEKKLKATRSRTRKRAKIYPSLYRPHEKDTQAIVVFPEETRGDVTLQCCGVDQETEATLINPYNATFIVPALSKPNLELTVVVDGEPTYDVTWQMYDVLSSMGSVDILRLAVGTDTVEELDNLLTQKFKETLTENELFNKLLDFPRTQNLEPSDKNHPSLLHVAAEFGLKELTTLVLSSPGGTNAMYTENCDRMYPADLARSRGHIELANYMIEYQDIKECADIYEYFFREDCIQLGVAKEQQEYIDPSQTEEDLGLYSPTMSFKLPSRDLPQTGLHSRSNTKTEKITIGSTNRRDTNIPIARAPTPPPLPRREDSTPEAPCCCNGSPECNTPRSTKSLDTRSSTRPTPDSPCCCNSSPEGNTPRSTKSLDTRSSTSPTPPPRPQRNSPIQETSRYCNFSPAWTTARSTKSLDTRTLTEHAPPPVPPRQCTSPAPAHYGSRGMSELVDIQKDVKYGHLNIAQAEHFFASWKDRYGRGSMPTTSFKAKQETLQKLRAHYDPTITTLRQASEPAKSRDITPSPSTATRPFTPLRQRHGSRKDTRATEHKTQVTILKGNHSNSSVIVIDERKT